MSFDTPASPGVAATGDHEAMLLLAAAQTR